MDLGAIVHDPAATLKIERLVDGVPVSPAVYNGTASGEINATGKIVYGYNLRVTAAGTYRITYTLRPGSNSQGAKTPAFCAGSYGCPRHRGQRRWRWRWQGGGKPPLSNRAPSRRL